MVDCGVAVVLDQGGVAEVQEAARLLPEEAGTQAVEVRRVATLEAGGMAQVDVAVDQAGDQVAAAAVDAAGSVGFDRRGRDCGDAPVADQNLGAGQGRLAFRRDQGDVADQQLVGGAGPGGGQQQAKQGAEQQGGHGYTRRLGRGAQGDRGRVARAT